MSDTEQLDHLVEIAEALGSGREPPTIEQVLAHGEMREEASFLKDVTDAAAMLWHEDVPLSVDEDVAVKRDVSSVGTDEAADDVGERCLARPGSSEHRREPKRRWFATGYLRECVDGRRKRLGFTRDVGYEGDSRAELSHGAREREDGAGDDARQHERQRDCQENPNGMGTECARRVLESTVDRIDGQLYRAHEERESHHGAGEGRARPPEREHDPERVSQEGADRPAAAEQEE